MRHIIKINGSRNKPEKERIYIIFNYVEKVLKLFQWSETHNKIRNKINLILMITYHLYDSKNVRKVLCAIIYP